MRDLLSDATLAVNSCLKQGHDGGRVIDNLWHSYRLCENQEQRDAFALALIGQVAVQKSVKEFAA